MPITLPALLLRPLFLTVLGASCIAPAAWAEAPTRWQSSFDAFEAADRERAPAPGGVVFVGSSSIRLWDGWSASSTSPTEARSSSAASAAR